jgi:anti-anti-sigma factor
LVSGGEPGSAAAGQFIDEADLQPDGAGDWDRYGRRAPRCLVATQPGHREPQQFVHRRITLPKMGRLCRPTIAIWGALRYSHGSSRVSFLDQSMSLSNYTKDGILTIVFDDSRILDETKLEELGRELTEMLNKTTEERVILDFRNVKFMSSSMLSKLVAVNKKAGEFKVKMKLCSIDPEIRQVFKITKLDKLFEIEADESSARAAFMKRGWFG